MTSISSNYGIKSVVLGAPFLEPALLQSSLHEVGVDVPVVKHPAAEEGNLIWCKDFMVTRVGKPYLIGFNDFGFEMMQVTALIPPYSLSREGHARCRSVGSGIFHFAEEIEKTISFLEQNKIPYQKSHCAFDGGNIHLFHDQTGKARAIIGFNTVVHTYVALTIQKFYEKYPDRLRFDIVPSEEAFYAARNMEVRRKYLRHEFNIYNKNTSTANRDLHERYKSELFSPISKEEKRRLLAQAIQIEKRFFVAKQELGKELGVEHPIFIPQRNFHIDMDLFPVNNKNVVFYHRDGDPHFLPYIFKIEAILNYHGLVPKPVFGIAEIAPKLNLMNALQIRDVLVFPTTDPCFSKIDEQFMQALKNEGVKVCRVTLQQDLYSLYKGGLSCCTIILYDKVD